MFAVPKACWTLLVVIALAMTLSGCAEEADGQVARKSQPQLASPVRQEREPMWSEVDRRADELERRVAQLENRLK